MKPGGKRQLIIPSGAWPTASAARAASSRRTPTSSLRSSSCASFPPWSALFENLEIEDLKVGTAAEGEEGRYRSRCITPAG